MIIYIIKMILCSGLFLLVYHLLLEKEKIYKFNRFYLLASLVLCFIIPRISWETSPAPTGSEDMVMRDARGFHIPDKIPALQPVAETFDPSMILWGVYGLVTFIFLFLFIRNLIRIFGRIAKNQVIPYQNSKIILINEQLTPHSFLHYIFIDRDAYREGQIESEILLHELTHVRQKHSLDVLFIEILRVIFWFNPVFLLYKRAVQLNHEFLADSAVTDSLNNTTAYQYLLISKASQTSSSILTSRFNFLITKKRLLMMTKTTNPVKALSKQLAMLPVIGLSVLLFSTRITAQKTPEITKAEKIPSNPQGATEAVMKEYDEMVKRYTIRKGNTIRYDFPASEQAKLEKMFLSMSKEQQDKQKVYFGKYNEPFEKEIPTPEQIEAWKDSKKYGLWIDEKRVSNNQLNKYKNTDFSHVFVSRLAKNAINYGKHYFQIDLMTTSYYENYVKETLANDKIYLMIRFGK